MATCVDCGSTCGLRYKVSLHEERYVCDKCYTQRQSNILKVIGGLLFLAFSAVVAAIATTLILKPVASAMGVSYARYLGLGLGAIGILGYIFSRGALNKTPGCLARLFIKTVGFISYALGVGMLVLTLFLGDTLKELVSDAGDVKQRELLSSELQ